MQSIISIHFRMGARPLLVRTLKLSQTALIWPFRNVGPFRYWTLSNVPLFLLATPALLLLIYSAADFIINPRFLLSAKATKTNATALHRDMTTVVALALPQLLIAILAFTSYHVQIITRLSSGYPLWYIWVAGQADSQSKFSRPIIRWMVIYSLVQAGLYAAFLPPA